MIWFFLLLSGYIAITDMAYRHISNYAVIAIAGLSVLAGTLSLSFVLPFTGVFFVGVTLFYAKVLAGGDVKLMLAYLLGIDVKLWSLVFLVVASLGAVMALGYLAYGYLSGSLETVRKKGLPYGIPIAIGGCFGVWLTSVS